MGSLIILITLGWYAWKRIDPMALEGQSGKIYQVFMTVSSKMERGMDTWEVLAMMGNILSLNGKMVNTLNTFENASKLLLVNNCICK